METDLKNPLFVSESYCTVAVYLFIHVSSINKICFGFASRFIIWGGGGGWGRGHILTERTC